VHRFSHASGLKLESSGAFAGAGIGEQRVHFDTVEVPFGVLLRRELVRIADALSAG
jgi:hypothetical protein